MRVVFVLVLTLAVTWARARAQEPPNPPAWMNIEKIMRQEEQKQQAKFKELARCGRGVVRALILAGAAWGAMRAGRAMRSRSRVVREEPQTRMTDPGPGPFATQPTHSTAVTDKPDTSRFTVKSSPTDTRDEASLLTKQLVLSNELGEDELIEHLGAPTETFTACPAVTIICFVVSVAFVGLGTVGGIATIRGTLSDRPNSLPLATAIGFGVPLSAMILGGIWLFVWAIRRFSYRLLVCPAGFIQVYRRKAVGAYWEQISAVDLTENTDKDGRTDRKCVVHREDGFKFVFRTDYPKRVGELMEMIVSHVRT
jgi:hypothetical protein